MPVDHTKNIVEISGVAFSYGDSPVLRNINLTIHQGDYLGLIGPNGSGKTTLLRIILGLLQPQTGEVRIFGKKLREFSDWSKVGYVSQRVVNFDQNFPATVSEVVMMGRFARLGLFHYPGKKDEKIVRECLAVVEMDGFKDRLIGDLSGGQQQRVFIARALAGKPEIIFLDEPTVGVDIKTQEEFYTLLSKLNKSMDLTLVLVSHDIDVVTNEVTEVAGINQSIVFYGPPKEFIQSDYINKLYGKGLKHILHRH